MFHEQVVILDQNKYGMGETRTFLLHYRRMQFTTPQYSKAIFGRESLLGNSSWGGGGGGGENRV